MDDQDICICARIHYAYHYTDHRPHLTYARTRDLSTRYRHPLQPNACMALEFPKETSKRCHGGAPISTRNVAVQVSSQSTGLLSLPNELQLHIWCHVFSDARLEFCLSPGSIPNLGLWQARPPDAAVLMTCQTVYREAAPILESQLVAHFPLELVDGTARSYRRRPRWLTGHFEEQAPPLSSQFARTTSHVLREDHLGRINRTIRSIQLPKITIGTLARIDLSEYTALRKVSISLLMSPDLRLPQAMSSTQNYDPSKLHELTVWEWSESPLGYLNLRQRILKVTARYVKLRSEEIYVRAKAPVSGLPISVVSNLRRKS